MINLFGDTVISNEVIHYLVWHQPFASLMLHGKKETRTNYTAVRGKVLILASEKPYPEHKLFEMSGPYLMYSISKTLEGEPTRNVVGKAIAIGTLVDCYPMKPQDEPDCYIKYREPWMEPVSDNEEDGATEKRLWIWDFKDVHRIDPLPFKGKQGWGILSINEINKIIYI